MSLLDRVKELCKSAGISQGKMEKEIGISNGASSKWRNSSPSLEILNKLSTYFGVSVDYLMNGNEENTEAYYLNDKTREVAQAIFDKKELGLLFDAAKDAQPEDLKTVQNMLRWYIYDFYRLLSITKRTGRAMQTCVETYYPTRF